MIYFVAIHCLMSVRDSFFFPLWPLAAATAAAGILNLFRIKTPCEPRAEIAAAMALYRSSMKAVLRRETPREKEIDKILASKTDPVYAARILTEYLPLAERINFAQSLAALTPQEAPFWIQTAYAATDAGDCGPGRNAYYRREASRLSPAARNHPAAASLASVYSAAGRFRETLRLYDSALKRAAPGEDAALRALLMKDRDAVRDKLGEGR